MPTQRTKYQHYVPRLHLKHFVGETPKGMVWVYDKQSSRCAPSKIAATGGTTNFYSIDVGNGDYNDTIDNMLQTIENRAAPIYERLLAGVIPTGQDRSDFAMFMATLYLRSPGKIRASAELFGKLMQVVMGVTWNDRDRFEKSIDLYEKEYGPSFQDRDKLWDLWQDKERYTIGVSQQQGLSALAASDDIHDILCQRRWYLLEAIEGYFITGDQAVTLWVPPSTSFFGNGGFSNERAEVTLALSPRRALMITGHHLQSSFVPAHLEMVANMNEQRAFHAERNLWSHQKDDAVLELAKKYKDAKHDIRLSNAGALAEVKARRKLN